MKTTFRLKNSKAKRESVIWVDINHQGQRTKFYTDVSVYPGYWRQEKQRIELPQRKKDLDWSLKEYETNINSKLSDLESRIKSYPRHCIKNDIQETAEGLKAYLNQGKNGSDKRLPVLFLTDYLENIYIPGCESGTLTYFKNNQHLKYAPGTIKSKNGVLATLQAYEKDTRQRIRLERVDMDFYQSFVRWSEQRHRINQTGKVIKEVKAVMRHAYDQGLHNNLAWDNKHFNVLREDIKAIALTEEELRSLAELSLNGRDKHYRDVFLVGCYTALRISDYKRLSPEHIKRRLDKDNQPYDAIVITTQKTKVEVVIPIAEEILPILKDPAFFGGRIIEQKFNKTIKGLCELAKLKDEEEVVRVVKGRKVTKRLKRYEMVTSHTARRTGATYLYYRGWPVHDIMQITGHKTEKAFLKYLKISGERSAKQNAHKIINSKSIQLQEVS